MSATVTTAATATTATIASRASEWGAVVVSLVVLIIFLAAIVVAWMTKDASLGILLGAASANATTAVGFWLGSSKGSADKTAALIGHPVTAAPAPTITATTGASA